ncbi:MAG: glycosyltransferase [Bacteroidaceae bacterium]|nr:glycosyltransferase [Bacteroidaceae bacterium]
MKILQLGKFYPIRGGVEKVMYDLMLGLSARGIDCDMLCGGVEGHHGDFDVNDHARVLCQRTWVKAAATTIAPSMILRLRRICSEYDIIHVHHPDPMACLALWLSGYKGKVVLHWHSDIEKQKMLLKLYLPLQNWLLRRADIVVGTTPVYLAESPHLTDVQQKTSVLPIGIEPVSTNPATVEELRKRYEGKRIVFSLGRLVPYKGFQYLVEAASYLPDDHVVLIGGGGPLREELQKQIDENGLQDKVRLIGRVSDEELPAYFGACDLFCLSSIQKTEAFAIVQIEAMSCGRPIVATRIPHSGVAWVNAHGESGLNAEPCDARDLASCITAITSDTDTYERLSEGARRRFEALFTLDRMIDGVQEIYQRVLAEM